MERRRPSGILGDAARQFGLSAKTLRDFVAAAVSVGEDTVMEAVFDEQERCKKEENQQEVVFDEQEVCKKEENQQELMEVVFDDQRPSDLIHRKQWKRLQFDLKDAPLYLCYRGPPPSCPNVPLVLLHKSFLDFRSDAQSFSEVGAEDMLAAFELWNLCSQGWDREVEEMTPAVNVFFAMYLHERVFPMEIGRARADGVVLPAKMIFEHKIELADSWFQGLDYFRRLFLSDKAARIPAAHGLLVLLACPYIQVVAVAWDGQDEKVLAEPLTSFQNCFGPRFEVINLAALLRALRIFCHQYTADPEVDPAVPFVFRDKSVRRLKGELVYLLEPDKVGKLTRRYCEQAHRQWADKNVAPRLFDVKPVGDGWVLVEMAFLSANDGWMDAQDVVSSLKGDADALQKLAECIKDAAAKGHSTNYVHGDMRLPNIKIRPLKKKKTRKRKKKKIRPLTTASYDIMFLDFDWAGEKGQAVYPAPLNPDLGWHDGAEFGKKIEVDHDLHFASNLVGQLPP